MAMSPVDPIHPQIMSLIPVIRTAWGPRREMATQLTLATFLKKSKALPLFALRPLLSSFAINNPTAHCVVTIASRCAAYPFQAFRNTLFYQFQNPFCPW